LDITIGSILVLAASAAHAARMCATRHPALVSTTRTASAHGGQGGQLSCTSRSSTKQVVHVATKSATPSSTEPSTGPIQAPGPIGGVTVFPGTPIPADDTGGYLLVWQQAEAN
jgi:hypothetical protein